MKLFTSNQIKEWDEFTWREEGIRSFQLMQRAARACYSWILKRYSGDMPVQVLCGPGNNGGDGLLIAAYLHQRGYKVTAFSMQSSNSTDRLHALDYAKSQGLSLQTLSNYKPDPKALLIDALFGHGMTRPLVGEFAEMVDGLNSLKAEIISIDMPSGMPSEPQERVFEVFVHGSHVLSFQQAKLSFFLDEYGAKMGSWEVIDIGLSSSFTKSETIELMDEELIHSIYQQKPRFSHKGIFGNALLIGGSAQYPGAIALATLACLASGAGKTFVATPEKSGRSCKTLAPEAIYLSDLGESYLSSELDLIPYDCVGIGPGLGMQLETQKMVLAELQQVKPWVIDADALNTLAKNPTYTPKGEVIITPHPGEFDRLTKKHGSNGSRWFTARALSKEKNWIVVLKGAYTTLFFPDGRQFINSSGNAGLAKGGSGDVLCGFMTGLIARGYSIEHASLIAVYLHGLAADRLNETESKDAIKAQDLISIIASICKQWED